MSLINKVLIIRTDTTVLYPSCIKDFTDNNPPLADLLVNKDQMILRKTRKIFNKYIQQ